MRLVVHLVFAFETHENLDGVLDGGLLDFHLLEAALQGAVLLDVFAELIQRGGTDDLHFTAAEGGLDDVAGIHGTFGGTGTDHGVHFVDEKDDVLRATNLVHDGLDALFKLTAILGASDHQSEVEGDHALLTQDFGHVAIHDLLSQAFDDGGLAHTGFTDQDRIVFRAAAEDLDDTGNLFRATDDGVHFAFLGEFGEVTAKGAKSGGLLVLLFLLRIFLVLAIGGDGLGIFLFFLFVRAEVRIEFLEDLIAGFVEIHIEVAQNLCGDAFTFTQQTEQDVLRADVAVIQGFGFLAGEGEHLLHSWSVRNVAHHLGFRTGADLLLDLETNGFEIEPELAEHVHGDALAELDEPEQDVLCADVVVVEAVCLLTCECQNLLGAWGEVIHGWNPRAEPLEGFDL